MCVKRECHPSSDWGTGGLTPRWWMASELFIQSTTGWIHFSLKTLWPHMLSFIWTYLLQCVGKCTDRQKPHTGGSIWMSVCVCGYWPASSFPLASVTSLMRRVTPAQMDERRGGDCDRWVDVHKKAMMEDSWRLKDSQLKNWLQAHIGRVFRRQTFTERQWKLS